MGLTKRGNFRVDISIYDSICSYVSKTKLNFSAFAVESMLYYIQHNPIKDATLDMNSILKQKELKRAREQSRINKHNLFFIKNWLKTFLDIARAQLFNNGGEKINIKVIRSLVKNMEEEFKHLPKETQTQMREDYKKLQLWKQETYAYHRLQYFQSLPKKEQKEFLRIG